MGFVTVLSILSCVLFAQTHCLPANSVYAGGLPIDIEQFPSVAAVLELQTTTGSFEHICAGAILTSFFVLTAGQCVTGRPLSVRVGSSFRSTGGTVIDVITTTVHPDYETSGSDIAVLGLGTPIVMNSPNVGQAPIPFQDLDPMVGMNAFVVGWSSNSLSEPPSEVLQFGILSITNTDLCSEQHSNLPSLFNVSNQNVCAVKPGVDFCDGGTGSPLFSSGVVVGLAAHTVDCGATNIPSIYTQVSRFTNWILTVASGVPSG